MKVSRAEDRRITRVLWRGGPIAVEDTELADMVARPGLRNFGLNVWTGPLIAAAQLGAIPLQGGGDVFRVVLLVLAFGLSFLALVANVRFRRGLLDRRRSTER